MRLADWRWRGAIATKYYNKLNNQDTTAFGQQFKVDWIVPDTAGIELRTIWEITSTNCNPRLISAFLKP